MLRLISNRKLLGREILSLRGAFKARGPVLLQLGESGTFCAGGSSIPSHLPQTFSRYTPHQLQTRTLINSTGLNSIMQEAPSSEDGRDLISVRGLTLYVHYANGGAMVGLTFSQQDHNRHRPVAQSSSSTCYSLTMASNFDCSCGVDGSFALLDSLRNCVQKREQTGGGGSV